MYSLLLTLVAFKRKFSEIQETHIQPKSFKKLKTFDHHQAENDKNIINPGFISRQFDVCQKEQQSSLKPAISQI